MWILINTVDCTVAGGPFADKPAALAGVRVVECALGYPDTIAWSPEACGFVDLGPTTSWNGTAWADDIAKVQAVLLDQIDDERETRQMTALTTGGAKKYVYNRKAQEALDARGVLASVLNALAVTDRKKKYPFAYAESVVTGDTLSTVLARFDAGMTASAAENARIEAVAQKAKRAVRAATTVAGKRAAYAAINWSVTIP